MKWILSIIITLALSISAYCEVLPDGSKFNLYNDFTGGLNTRDPPHKLRQDESPFIRNCLIDEGEIDPPSGTAILGSTNTLQKISLLKRYVKDDGTIEFIVSDSSVVLKTQDFSIYTLLKSGLNGNYRLRAKQVESKMYFTNGSDSPWTYNGTTVVVLDGGTYNIGKTPNMPKFKYLEYFQNRLWGFNLPDNPSALRWHLLQSTDTVPIAYAPDHELAWSNSNLQLNIDKGNGTVGTFLRVYAGQLFVGKERGIHYIYGNDDTNYNPVPIVKDYGFLSDESVVEQDNVLLGYGNDGIYEFNGQQMTRISDKIFPDILAINSGVTKNVTLTWETQSDFARGKLNNTTATYSGSLVVSTNIFTNIVSTMINTIDNVPPIVSELIMVYPSYPYTVFKPTVPFADDKYGFSISNIGLYADGATNGAPGHAIIKNARTNETQLFLYSVITAGAIEYRTQTNQIADSPCFTKNDVLVGNLQIAYESSNNNFYFYQATGTGNADITIIPSTNGCASAGFISDVATTTALTGWSNLSAESSLTNGEINYFYRASTSVVTNPQTKFTSINSGGSIFTASSNTYIQWASTITTYSSNTLSSLDSVQIVYQTGGGSDTNPFGQSWRNRYYLFVTTTTTGLTNLCYVKSRSGTKNQYGWSVLEGINVKSSLATPDVWYLGSSTAGVIVRGDYGTNYNGNAINQIYETHDNNFEQPFMNKNILEYGIDTDYVANSIYTLSTSIDNGTYVDQPVNNNGSGRMIRRLSYPSLKGNRFKVRFSNSQLDKPMHIYNFIEYFKENATRTNTP